jgi:hypothetical protein
MLKETDKQKLKNLKVLEYIGYDERPNTYYLIQYEGKKAIMNIEPELPAGIRLFFTPFVYGVDAYLDEEDIEENFKEVFDKNDDAFNYDEYLKDIGAEQLTNDNYEDYCKVQEELDKEPGDYSLNVDEHEEIVELLSLTILNPNVSYWLEEDYIS